MDQTEATGNVSAEKSGWQPIATEPKGSFDVWVVERTARTLTQEPGGVRHTGCYRNSQNLLLNDRGTRVETDGAGFSLVATHWMPIPKAPSNDDRSDEPKRSDSE